MSRTDPRIALVITDEETNAQIKHLGVGLLELRADLFKRLTPEYCVSQVMHRRLLKVPLLLTVRNQKSEGAFHAFSDEIKLKIITAALPLVDMVDIELRSPLFKTVMRKARDLDKKVIVSSHFLQGTPKDLEAVLKRSLKTGADIVKIAAKAASFDDVLAITVLTHRHRRHRPITMSLGPLGAISRLILPAAGSRYTYTYLNKPTAPGQVDVVTLKSHLKTYYPDNG